MRHVNIARFVAILGGQGAHWRPREALKLLAARLRFRSAGWRETIREDLLALVPNSLTELFGIFENYIKNSPVVGNRDDFRSSCRRESG